jgi:hypothetical protein
VEKLEPHALLVGMLNGTAIMNSSLAFPQKIKNRTTMESRNSTLGYKLEIIESRNMR